MQSKNLYFLFISILFFTCLANILTKNSHKYHKINTENLKASYRSDLGQSLSVNNNMNLNSLSLLNLGHKINVETTNPYYLSMFSSLGIKSATKLKENKKLNTKQEEMFKYILLL